jgi:hypothetical protein
VFTQPLPGRTYLLLLPRVPRPVPCRLTYLNLSTLLHHILLLAKAAPVQQQQEQQEPGQAQGGQEGNEPSEAEEEQQLAALLGDICERLERRCHMWVWLIIHCPLTCQDTAGKCVRHLAHVHACHLLSSAPLTGMHQSVQGWPNKKSTNYWIIS